VKVIRYLALHIFLNYLFDKSLQEMTTYVRLDIYKSLFIIFRWVYQ